jgi:hypothetical protein
MLSVFVLSVVMLSVVMLSGVKLNVEVPAVAAVHVCNHQFATATNTLAY